MFGLGKSNFGFNELTNELERWGWKPVIIKAFMREYSGLAFKYYKNMTRAYSYNHQGVQSHVMESDLAAMALVEAAYDAWEKYLQYGKGVLTS